MNMESVDEEKKADCTTSWWVLSSALELSVLCTFSTYTLS